MVKRAKFNLRKKIRTVLEAAPNKEHTSREIAEKIYELFPDDCQSKLDRSKSLETEEELIVQIQAEIGSTWRELVESSDNIRTVETRPRLFYFTTKSEEEEVADDETDNVSSAPQKLSEHDLYPLLGVYLYSELDCLSMRIDERKSSNSHGSKGNQWLFPDIVGMIDLSKEWHQDLSDLAESLAARRVRLVSVEVKKTINRSNVREAIFQTVSNSSWANEAYLAAAKLDTKATAELRLLCVAHGIGFISLNTDEPTDSQMLIPARYNDKINYNALNRLVKENSDAREYMDNVSSFLKLRKFKKKDWDLAPEDLL